MEALISKSKINRPFSDLTFFDIAFITFFLVSFTFPSGQALFFYLFIALMHKPIRRWNSNLVHQLIGARILAKYNPQIAQQLKRFTKLRSKKKRTLTPDQKQERAELEKLLIELGGKPVISLYHLRLDIVIVALALGYHVANLSILFPEFFYKFFRQAPNIHLLNNLFS